MTVPILRPCRVAISVLRVETSATWYQTMLGFHFSSRMDFDDYGVRIVFLEQSGFWLELIEKKGSAPVKQKLPDLQDENLLQGFKKLAFEVSNIEKITANFKKNHVKFLFDLTEDIANPKEKTKWCIIEDPDGNWLQFFQKLP